MDKDKLFVEAMRRGLYRNLNWVISAFSITKAAASPDESKAEFLDLYRDDSGHYVLNEEGKFVRLEADPKMPLFSADERLDLDTGDVENLRAGVNTRYGTLLANSICLIYPFGNKIPYINGAITVRGVEDIILKNFLDDPEVGGAKDSKAFYVSEYLRFCEAKAYLMGMGSLFVWAATKKVLLPPPGIVELRNKLLKENEGHLNELSTIAKIGEKLLEHDAAWLKGDPGGEKFITKGKARNVVRMKKFLMHGPEQGMAGGGINAVLVPRSLHEGWDVKYFPEMNNSLRAGSYNRGAETQLGGVTVKWLYRASSNCAITVDDCGSDIGSEITLTPAMLKRFMGMTIISQKQQVKLLDASIAEAYLGKKIMVRNPMYCKLNYTDYCRTCVGDRLAVNPYGLATATSDYGSVFLSLFMKAMHGKSLSTSKVNLAETIL